MSPRLSTLALALLGLSAGWARAADDTGGGLHWPEPGPIEISAADGARYQNHVAIGEGSVSIQRDGTSIYADYGEYHIDTHEAILVGHVRIYRDNRLILADRARYNLETGALTSEKFDGTQLPYFFSGQQAVTEAKNQPLTLTDAFATTHDSSDPDFRIRARTVIVYPNDRVVYKGVKLYVGQTPIMYLPYFVTSLEQREEDGLDISPGQSSTSGVFLLTKYGIPVSQALTIQTVLDYRSLRGLAGGLNFYYRPNAPLRNRDKQLNSYAPSEDEEDRPTGPLAITPKKDPLGLRSTEGGRLLTYFLEDQDPNLNKTSIPRVPISPGRYRIEGQDVHYFTDDLYFKVYGTKLSDQYVLQDFFRREFAVDPQPDNAASFTWRKDNYTLTIIGRYQLNNFYDSTERLPEVVLDLKRQELGDSGIYYEGETGTAYLKRYFATDSVFRPSYAFFRFDSFHQFTYPQTFFNWLNIVPRVGFRVTYYSETAPNQTVANELGASTYNAGQLPAPIPQFTPTGALWRPLVNAGFESSFKLTRIYNFQSRLLGLDRLQHVIEPYVNFAFVQDLNNQTRVPLPADRLQPTTALNPIDFPQFTAIDSIQSATVARMGVRQRFQTKRDALTFNWLELDSFFQRDFRNPYTFTKYSNFFQSVRFRPVPWMALSCYAQFPIDKFGFTEVNTAVRFMPTSNLEFEIGQRYLNKNPYFPDSSLTTYRVFYRLGENWAVGAGGRYEFNDRTFESQSYTIYRDLTSFVGSVSAIVNNNRGVKESGFLVTFTLKDLPRVSQSLNNAPAATSTSQLTQF
jgi:LPS-assembly protein